MSEQELREDIYVLNVVNFGGGTYVLYAEVLPSGEIEVDPEPYSDTFDRPARLLPIEAKALVAAIDLLGDTCPPARWHSAREKIVAALGEDPVRRGCRSRRRRRRPTSRPHGRARRATTAGLLELEYYVGTRSTSRSARVEPYALINGARGLVRRAPATPPRTRCATSGWTGSSSATALDEHFERRPDLDPIADIEGWPRTGEVEGSRIAHVWISPEQARWAREERTVVAELEDGAIVVEWAFKGDDYLVKEVLKEAGDAAVLEPADVREAVLAAAERLLALSS